MKKFKIYIVLLAISTLFILSSCTKKKNCTELAADYSAAWSAYFNNPTRQTCEEFYDAAREYLDNCTPANRQSIQDDLDNEDCSQYPYI